MDRQKQIEKLRAEIAILETDLAAREARTARGGDPIEWESHSLRQSNSPHLVYKDFPVERQISGAPEIFSALQTRTIGEALSIFRRDANAEVDSKLEVLRSELQAQIDDLQVEVSALRADIEAIQQEGSGYGG
jgi:hypothetical protein